MECVIVVLTSIRLVFLQSTKWPSIFSGETVSSLLERDQKELERAYRLLEYLLVDEEVKVENMTEDHMKTMMEMMTFLLSHAKSYQNQKITVGRDICNNLLWRLSTFLLITNQKLDCEAWIQEHLQELHTLRSENGDSLLHVAAERQRRRFPNASFVKLLLEGGQMDVNVVNIKRQTPLHLLCSSGDCSKLNSGGKPTEDTMRIAEMLINNGAHMDAVDIYGNEASGVLSKYFPKWTFNFGLKCLAARALIKHGVRYENNYVPAKMIRFIRSHDPGCI